MRKRAKESTTHHVRGPICKWSIRKMQSETTGFLANSWRIRIALECSVEEHAKEVWDRNWMNLEGHATLFYTYPPKLIP